MFKRKTKNPQGQGPTQSDILSDALELAKAGNIHGAITKAETLHYLNSSTISSLQNAPIKENGDLKKWAALIRILVQQSSEQGFRFLYHIMPVTQGLLSGYVNDFHVIDRCIEQFQETIFEACKEHVEIFVRHDIEGAIKLIKALHYRYSGDGAEGLWAVVIDNSDILVDRVGPKQALDTLMNVNGARAHKVAALRRNLYEFLPEATFDDTLKLWKMASSWDEGEKSMVEEKLNTFCEFPDPHDYQKTSEKCLEALKLYREMHGSDYAFACKQEGYLRDSFKAVADQRPAAMVPLISDIYRQCLSTDKRNDLYWSMVTAIFLETVDYMHMNHGYESAFNLLIQLEARIKSRDNYGALSHLCAQKLKDIQVTRPL